MADQDPGSPEPDNSQPSFGYAAKRGARLAGAGWLFSQGLTFVAYIVLARLASPHDFGAFAAGSVIVSYGFLFSESGMLSALIKHSGGLEEAASSAFFSLLASGLLLTGAAVAASPLIALFFHNPEAGRIAFALAPWLFLRSMTVVPDALLQRRFSFARRVAVDPLGAIAFGAVAIAGCSAGWGAWGLVAGSYASEIVEVTSSWLFAGFRPRWGRASVAVWRELAAFARPVVGSEILRQIAGHIDTLVLGRSAGAAALGQYTNAMRLAAQPGIAFVSVGSYVLLPTMARLADQGSSLRSVTRRVLSASARGAIPVSVATLPLGVPIAVILLGQRWRPAGHAIAGLSGLLVGIALMAVCAELIKAVGRPDLLVRIQSVALTVTVIAVVGAGIPFGLIGVAVAMSASQCVTGLYSFALARSLIDMSWGELGRDCLRPALASAGMLTAMVGYAALVSPLGHAELLAIVLMIGEVLVGAIIYLALLAALDRHFREALRGWRSASRSASAPA